jgi:hypothetical protein
LTSGFAQLASDQAQHRGFAAAIITYKPSHTGFYLGRPVGKKLGLRPGVAEMVDPQ